MVMHPYITQRAVESHIDDLRRAAEGTARARPANDGAPSRPKARALPLAVRRFGRAKRSLGEASEPCT